MSNQIVKGSWAEMVSANTLEAIAITIKAKMQEASKAGKLPPDWKSFADACNKCEAFKDLLHDHAHAIMDVEERGGCQAISSAIAAAVVWGLEIAQAMSESTELDKLMVN